jgi:hypothetical protein
MNSLSLVCWRRMFVVGRVGACSIYNPSIRPRRLPLPSDHPPRADATQKVTGSISRGDHWPIAPSTSHWDFSSNEGLSHSIIRIPT